MNGWTCGVVLGMVDWWWWAWRGGSTTTTSAYPQHCLPTYLLCLPPTHNSFYSILLPTSHVLTWHGWVGCAYKHGWAFHAWQVAGMAGGVSVFSIYVSTSLYLGISYKCVCISLPPPFLLLLHMFPAALHERCSRTYM